MGAICDDCGYACRDACAFISDTEQPYFQSYRLAKRIPLGVSWDAWDYMAWNSAMWRAFSDEHGLGEAIKALHAGAFKDWLFRRVGHPMAEAA